MNELLDHVIWACEDLERGTARFESLTGVRPRYGGVHASGRTHNALVALGERCYLEILAPTGAAVADEDAWCRFARTAREPRVLTYCMRSALPLAELALLAQSAGADPAQVAANGRTTPEGVQLRWQWVGPTFAAFGWAFPFFIDWLDSPHPGGAPQPAAPQPAAPQPAAPDGGIRLSRFAVGHPQATALAQVLGSLDVAVETYPAAVLEFQVVLDTPRGAVAL
jgi:hypothetical protein